jgi:hypothetical protein
MNQHNHDTANTDVPDNTLETADAVARAAHIWIRSLWQDELQADEERRALAGGLISGLCDRLELSPRVSEVVAYVYTLLDNEGSDALAVSRAMINTQTPKFLLAYERGRAEASGILEKLAYHEKSL